MSPLLPTTTDSYLNAKFTIAPCDSKKGGKGQPNNSWNNSHTNSAHHYHDTLSGWVIAIIVLVLFIIMIFTVTLWYYWRKERKRVQSSEIPFFRKGHVFFKALSLVSGLLLILLLIKLIKQRLSSRRRRNNNNSRRDSYNTISYRDYYHGGNNNDRRASQISYQSQSQSVRNYGGNDKPIIDTVVAARFNFYVPVPTEHNGKVKWEERTGQGRGRQADVDTLMPMAEHFKYPDRVVGEKPSPLAGEKSFDMTFKEEKAKEKEKKKRVTMTHAAAVNDEKSSATTTTTAEPSVSIRYRRRKMACLSRRIERRSRRVFRYGSSTYYPCVGGKGQQSLLLQQLQQHQWQVRKRQRKHQARSPKSPTTK